MENDIIVIDYNQYEIFKSEIDVLVEEYISSLSNPEMIYKSIVFKGLLEYIYKHKLKQVINDSKYRSQYDYNLIDNVFYNIYIPLCTSFNIAPNVLSFSSFLHLDYSTIIDIKSGIYRNTGSKVNFDTSHLVKNWFSFCESGLLDKTISENSIGSMFALKSVYAYSDQNTIVIEQKTEQLETAEQIAEKHKNAMIPEKPILT